jgi:hypothetical protein
VSTEPVPLSNVIAALAAAYPITPERAAANARLLDEEVAAYDEAHASDEEDSAA